MKKHDEGYVLSLVLVVILVLCLVASAILAGALSNIKAQYGQIERMQDKYDAQGKLEILVSQLETEAIWVGKEYKEESIAQVIDDLCSAQTDIQRYSTTEESDPEKAVFAQLNHTYTFTVTAQAGDTQVSARLELTLTVSDSTISSCKAKYVAYKTGEVVTS